MAERSYNVGKKHLYNLNKAVSQFECSSLKSRQVKSCDSSIVWKTMLVISSVISYGQINALTGLYIIISIYERIFPLAKSDLVHWKEEKHKCDRQQSRYTTIAQLFAFLFPAIAFSKQGTNCFDDNEHQRPREPFRYVDDTTFLHHETGLNCLIASRTSNRYPPLPLSTHRHPTPLDTFTSISDKIQTKCWISSLWWGISDIWKVKSGWSVFCRCLFHCAGIEMCHDGELSYLELQVGDRKEYGCMDPSVVINHVRRKDRVD